MQNVATPTEKPNLILETERIARDVTIGISAFRRPGCVEQLVKSIRRYYPTTHIIIGDNGDQPANIVDAYLTYLRLPFNIGDTTTETGLTINAELDPNSYENV